MELGLLASGPIQRYKSWMSMRNEPLPSGPQQAVLHHANPGFSVLTTDDVFRRISPREIRDALLLLGELDCLYAMAEATEACGWSMPEIVASDVFVLRAEDIRHPFLTSARGNPMDLAGGEALVFLTGPNMAGKPTYLRAVALIPFLSQIGMGVPPERARLTAVRLSHPDPHLLEAIRSKPARPSGRSRATSAHLGPWRLR